MSEFMAKAEALRRKTKIVATLGPASQSPEIIHELIRAGANVFRLNFSHGTHEEHSRLVSIVREESAKLDRNVAIFQDLCGPKVRIGEVEGGEVHLTEGQAIRLRPFDGSVGTNQTLYVQAFDPTLVIKPGEQAFLSDGQIELLAKTVSREAVDCLIISGGILRSRSGIAVPQSRLDLPCITEKDVRDIEWAVKADIDYVALSFVRRASDIQELRERLSGHGVSLPIIAKIERAKVMDELGEVVEAADAVMVARGDLGLELPLERVPGAQKLIIEQANLAGTPVITATQMLRSMIREQRPTRAEVSDVCTAVRDGTDAVMLSDETAIGKHPVQAVQVLDRILQEAEHEFVDELSHGGVRRQDRATVSDAVCFAATSAATKLHAAAIIVCTQSGHTARLMAKYRPLHNVFAVTPEKRSLARMSLNWGIEPIFVELPEEVSTDEEINLAITAVRDQYGLKPGSRVVVTAGLRTKRSGMTNVLQIREIPRTS